MALVDQKTIEKFVGKELQGFSIEPGWDDPAAEIILEFADGSQLIVRSVGLSDGTTYLDIEDSSSSDGIYPE
jgi:hypothetical protein